MDTEGEREGEMDGESSADFYALSCVKRWLVGSCCVTPGAQFGAQ